MRHRNKGRKFGRVRSQRTALLRSLARSLILHGKIETTEAKAKELRPFIEKLITKSREEALPARREVIRILGNEAAAARKLFTDIAPRYRARQGGYTRITKIRKNASDARKVSMIEFV